MLDEMMQQKIFLMHAMMKNFWREEQDHMQDA
jgi:hypothetical protein